MNYNRKNNLRHWFVKYSPHVELAFLVIVYYLKMRPVMENWSNKYLWFAFLQKGMSKIIYYVKVYKELISIILYETYSVLILKERVWKSTN